MTKRPQFPKEAVLFYDEDLPREDQMLMASDTVDGIAVVGKRQRAAIYKLLRVVDVSAKTVISVRKRRS